MSPVYKYISSWGLKSYSAVGWTLMIVGMSSCVMSFVCAVVLGLMDKRADRILKKDTAETGEVVSFYQLAAARMIQNNDALGSTT